MGQNEVTMQQNIKTWRNSVINYEKPDVIHVGMINGKVWSVFIQVYRFKGQPLFVSSSSGNFLHPCNLRKISMGHDLQSSRTVYL